ncbi:carboxymuconolactone decarboxylase family protein [Kutzneria viridogrisea]
MTHVPRLNVAKEAPSAYRALLLLNKTVHDGVDPKLAELVKIRASQLNSCGFCIDMHTTEARKAGESERRIYALPAFREVSFYTARECAALELTEAVTLVSQGGVSDQVWAEAEKHFSPEELSNLLLLIATINAWNRIGVSTRLQPPAEEA